jgi:hypothetical protein
MNMSVSGAISELDGVLKKTYHGGINEQMASGSLLLSRLYAFGSSKPVEGEEPTFETQYERSRGVGFRSTATAIPTLPTPGTGGDKQIKVSIPEFYGAEQMTQRQLESATGAGAYIKTFNKKLNQLMRDSKDAMAVSIYNGKNGAITKVATANTLNATTLVVEDKVRLQRGNFVDIIDTDGTTVLFKHLKVTNFNTETYTVTFDFTVATDGADSSVSNFGTAGVVAVGDYFVFEDSNGLSYTGMEQQVGELTTTIHDIDRSAYPYYSASKISADAGASAEDFLDSTYIRRLKNKIKIETSGNYGFSSDGILTTPHVKSGFEETLQNQVRYDVMQGDKAPNLVAGFAVLKHDEMDVLDDRYATDDSAYLISTPSFQLWMMADTQFLEENGSIFNRIPGKPAYEFGIYNYMELVSYELKANGVIDNLKGLGD